MDYQYSCSECGAAFDFSPQLMLCPKCQIFQKDNEPLRGILEVIYNDGNKAQTPDALWPVDAQILQSVPSARSPLWKSEKLEKATGFKNLWLKDDTRNLTGSYKDRASILVATIAKKWNIKEIVLASTGNAASSMAGIGAFWDMNVTIFLPETAPRAKMVQSLQYAARVINVAGNYDLAFELSLQYSEKYQVLSRNTAYNPLTIEGKKSGAFEIFYQLGKVPDYCFVPTGDGVILSGLYKGFYDLYKYGFTNNIPIMIAVQPDGSAAIYYALQNGFFTPIAAQTVADSISVDVPRGGYYALKMLQKYGGKSVTVSDEAILNAQKELSGTTGLFAEPAAAAAYAGFLKMKANIPQDADIVLLITGSGLKDIDSAMHKVDFPKKSIRSLDDLE
ncbi:MAG TPA: pyridoxal-phosphate dependent enzyme [Candidatus Marinimicrobia bacterium]|nr:pyridoxal-phosphate dependent enzyme [Candidatus Neomarinimicrobiota bacterium]